MEKTRYIWNPHFNGWESGQEHAGSFITSSFCHFLYTSLLSNRKRLSIITFLKKTLVSLTLRADSFLKFLKKCNQLRRTGLLRRSKLVYLDGEKFTCFFQNLVETSMKLVLNSKIHRK